MNQFGGIFNCTVGLVFFGTPFRGANEVLRSHAKLLEYAERIHQEVYHENYQTFDPGNDALLNVVEDFLEATGDGFKPKTICFYEKKRTDVGRFLGRKGQDEVSVLQIPGYQAQVQLSTRKGSCCHSCGLSFRPSR